MKTDGWRRSHGRGTLQQEPIAPADPPAQECVMTRSLPSICLLTVLGCSVLGCSGKGADTSTPAGTTPGPSTTGYVTGACDETVDRDCDGVEDAADCDPDDPYTYPGADDIPYDGIDNDCAGDGDLVDVDGELA